MKTLTTALAAHHALGSTTLAQALRITRRDGLVLAVTSAVSPVTLSGVTYSASQGLDISSLETSAGFDVDNLELTTLDDGSVFNKADVLGGVWRDAAFQILRYNWASPTDGVDILLTGTVGEVQLRRGSIVAELRGLQQYLQQPIGHVSSITCRARLGDSTCGVVLSGYTVTGTITSVASRQVFSDSSKIQAADWFSEGLLTFTTGTCATLQQKVKAFGTGQFTLSLPMLKALTVGDQFTVVAGCRKRLSEDCAGKFNNVLNFQGEPHLPGTDQVTA
jgi:uncharacterized phage protein (TIGR02218 family)